MTIVSGISPKIGVGVAKEKYESDTNTSTSKKRFRLSVFKKRLRLHQKNAIPIFNFDSATLA